MLNVRHMNPMVRAVGTMGAVAAVVGGITFASLTSNTVALSSNTLASATAHLKIGLTNDTTCADANNGPRKGMDFTLTPGVTSPEFQFCLKNTGTVPLDLTTAIPQSAFSADTGIPPSDVTLALTCSNGGSTSGTLNTFTGGTSLGSLASGAETDCQATATLSTNSTANGKSVPSFEIDFVGTQSSS